MVWGFGIISFNGESIAGTEAALYKDNTIFLQIPEVNTALQAKLH